MEKHFRKHLEDNGFFSKYQSGFRKSKSTNDHLFRLSQTIIESFNQGEHVTAAFLDVEKVFDNVWHNGLRYKIYQPDLPTKLCTWISDFLVGRVIQIKTEGFLSPNVYPKAGVPQGFNLSPLLFLIYVNPSFAKPFGTHTFYQGGDRVDPPAISETVAAMNVKLCRVLETYLKVLDMFTWLP